VCRANFHRRAATGNPGVASPAKDGKCGAAKRDGGAAFAKSDGRVGKTARQATVLSQLPTRFRSLAFAIENKAIRITQMTVYAATQIGGVDIVRSDRRCDDNIAGI
jgi:hypothetical protein